MPRCLSTPTSLVVTAACAALLMASCGSQASQSAPRSTTQVSGIVCAQATAEYASITKTENQLGNTSAMTAELYASRVASIAKASAWLANHATGVSLNARNFWRVQNLSMSEQITKAAKSGTSTDDLLQYSSTAQNAAFLHDGQRVISFFVAACPSFAAK